MSALTLNKENFLEETAEGVTLIDFWAAWCGPCRVQLPIVDELASDLVGTAKVAKVNIDQEPELAAAFRIRSIPTLAIMKDGKIVDLMMGLQSKEVLKQKILQTESI